jgi:hypothetical protein
LEQLHQRYTKASGEMMPLRKFVGNLLELMGGKDALARPMREPGIVHFTLKLHKDLPQVHLLMRSEEDGSLGNLRVATTGADAEVSRICKQMDAKAMRTHARWLKAAAEDKVGQAGQHFHSLWVGPRKDEFLELYEECRKQPGQRYLSGGQFLQMFPRLVAEQHAQRETTAVESIDRFNIKLPVPSGRRVDVLLRFGPDGSLADIRLLSSPQEERHKLDAMQTSERSMLVRADPQARAKVSSAVIRVQRRAKLWRARREQFAPEYAAFCEVARKSGKRVPSGVTFMKHVSDLCDADEGTVLDEGKGITHHEVLIEGSAKRVTLLVGKDEHGLAAVERVGNGLSETKALKAIRVAMQKSEAQASASAAPLVSPSTDRPTRMRAFHLQHALERVIENLQHSRDPFDGLEEATGLPGKVLRSWLDHEGRLKRKPSVLAELPGYFLLRDELHVLFTRLGHTEVADAMPKHLSARFLLECLKARLEYPEATGGDLAHVTSASTELVFGHFDSKTWALKTGDATLRSLNDYRTYREDIKACLEALGQGERAGRLPTPETEAETLLRKLRGKLYQVGAAIEAMRSDATLSLPEAADLVDTSRDLREVLAQVCRPDGTMLSQDEIAARVPGFDPAMKHELARLVGRLQGEAPATSGMTTMVMRWVRGTGATERRRANRLFIVNAGRAGGASTGIASNLWGVYAHSPGLVRAPRSYKAERPRQSLRWLATTLKQALDKASNKASADAREVQCYWDATANVIWVSSNKNETNHILERIFQEPGKLQKLLRDTPSHSHESREGRHIWKLRRALADGSQRGQPPELRALLELMSKGSFRVPTETYELEYGEPVNLHAERRIKEEFLQATGRSMDRKYLAGTMRPCGFCATALGFDRGARRGPFWLTRAGPAFLDANEVIENDLREGIGSYVTKQARKGRLTLAHDTDSDSDTEPLLVYSRRAKRSASQALEEPRPAKAATLPDWAAKGARTPRGVRFPAGDNPLPVMPPAAQRQRERDLQELHRQAEEACRVLRSIGVALPFEVPVGREQTQQVLQQLLDEGARRFKRFVRQLERSSAAQPDAVQTRVLGQIGEHCATLRRSSVHVGWLPETSAPGHSLPADCLPDGEVWTTVQQESVFSKGSASGTRNICWFDSIAQLKLGKPRGQGETELVEHLALRLRQAADALGLSREGEMFDDDNGAMHLIARALNLQVHTFRRQPDGLRLTALQSVGSPDDPAVFLWSDDVHFVPMWRKNEAQHS